MSHAKTDELEFSEFGGQRTIKVSLKWPKRRIPIALSDSLHTPGPNIKPGSDVRGAVHRALARWTTMANITFIETNTPLHSISSGSGDGVSLITIADTAENNALFGNPEMTGRTRLFYDAESGSISEADICINPHPTLMDGTPVQFSTDGTPGTYDLESTFTHEIGHLLGLDHSSVMAATMQAVQGLNGVYGLPAFTGRTLSEEDRERIRSLYGPEENTGAIEGRVIGSFPGAQVWAENTTTGRVAGSTTLSQNGNYLMEALPANQYRVLIEQSRKSAITDQAASDKRVVAAESVRLVRATEIAAQVSVQAGEEAAVSTAVVMPRDITQILNPRLIGMNGEISAVALPLEAGRRFTVYLAGEGVDQVPGTAISVSSPFFKVDPDSLAREQFSSSWPVISFNLDVAANAPFGDYTIRLQSISGEVAYLTGAITLDPGVNSIASNPVDDPRFFITQQYHDFLARQPDRSGLEYWARQLNECGSDAACLRTRRLEISLAFTSENESQQTGSFIYGLYKVMGRKPTFPEFSADRALMVASGTSTESRQRSIAAQIVTRPEFLKKYPSEMTGGQFVDAVLSECPSKVRAPISAQVANLAELYDGTDAGRATILSRIITNPAFVGGESNAFFVLMQYFAYLRRDADDAGYKYWLHVLETSKEPEGFRSVACAFLNSAEYQSRFGMVITHTKNECPL